MTIPASLFPRVVISGSVSASVPTLIQENKHADCSTCVIVRPGFQLFQKTTDLNLHTVYLLQINVFCLKRNQALEEIVKHINPQSIRLLQFRRTSLKKLGLLL